MNENKKWYLYLIVLAVGVIFCIWYIFGGYISDNGSGADAVRGKLQDVGAGIDASQKHADNLETELNGIEERITSSQSGIGRSLELHSDNEKRIEDTERGIASLEDIIKQSQSIIKGIRKRSETNAKAAN